MSNGIGLPIAAKLIGLSESQLRRYVQDGRVLANKSPLSGRIYFTPKQLNTLIEKMECRDE